jgi:tRNA(adenine34) deaminase
MDQWAADVLDRRMMRRCIELSRMAVREGEFPFAALVFANDGTVIAEATNRVARDKDVTRHAELLAVSAAQTILGQAGLAGCTIYSSVEPCVMCSFPIRESRIARVVFGIRSPMMGGFSRWNVLGDGALCEHMPEYFNAPPDVLADFLAEEAEKAWTDWSPEIWAIITSRGCFETVPRPVVSGRARRARGVRRASGADPGKAQRAEPQVERTVHRRF